MNEKDLEKAIKHLKKDVVLKKVIERFEKPNFKKSNKYFEALVRAIIYQQLSGKVASVIEERFIALLQKDLSPKKILSLKDEDFRGAGVSKQKISYLKDLSLKFLDGTIDSKDFKKMSDEEIKDHLVRVKGVGPWTADMFLMFTLCRQDVLPTGDLGIKKGFQKVFSMKNLPSVEKMEKLSKNWSPYRTVASRYLWKVSDEMKK